MRTRSETGVFICPYSVFNSDVCMASTDTPGAEFEILSATSGNRRCLFKSSNERLGVVFRRDEHKCPPRIDLSFFNRTTNDHADEGQFCVGRRKTTNDRE